MLKATHGGFETEEGIVKRFIELHPTHSPEGAWVDRQEASVQEYLDQTEEIPEEIETLYALFDCFISACLADRSKQLVLDVGCGIRGDWPHYVRSLHKAMPTTGHIYVGLDPLPHSVDSREYPFLAGRLEDLPGKLSDSFDVFLFSTSLDHFQDLSFTAHTVKKIANRDALAIFWVGLHDYKLVAEHAGAQVFGRLFASLSPLQFLAGFLKTSAKILTKYIWLLRRQGSLASGEPLDKLHFHYFTEATLRNTLSLFGRIERYVRVPGTNSVFVSVRMQ